MGKSLHRGRVWLTALQQVSKLFMPGQAFNSVFEHLFSWHKEVQIFKK